MGRELENLYKNSWFVAIIAFCIVGAICYWFKLGYRELPPGTKRSLKDYNIAYPAAIAGLVWILWYFCLFPHRTIKGQIDVNTIKPQPPKYF